MTKHFYLSLENSPPTPRWQAAFPEGRCVDRAGLDKGAAAEDMAWLATADPAWPERLFSLRHERSELRCVVVSLAPARREAARALDLGARAYCHAFATVAQLHEVAVVVSHGGLWLGPDLMDGVMRMANRFLRRQGADSPEMGRLSGREAEVARAVASGLSNKEVANRLGITERTVKAHLGAVFDKLGVRDRIQLVLRLAGEGEVASERGH